MTERIDERLSHVLWIGGSADAGKTSIARILSGKHRLPVYHYDQADLRHHIRLAQTSPRYAAFLNASMDERWVHPEPDELAERAWLAFRDRSPLATEDLAALSFRAGMHILAEGLGFTPGLLKSLLKSSKQAVWLLPTEEFKLASMQRREKGKFGGQVGDPHRATRNLLERDRLLRERIRADAIALNMTIIKANGSESVEHLAARVANHFGVLDV
jgi:2-phosphoglycerate kinase